MRRRDLLALLGGVAVTWPTAAITQQSKRQGLRGVGVLTGASGPVSDARVRMFVQGLAELGWLEGRNLRIDVRHGGGDSAALRRHAEELVSSMPDVLVANGGTATQHLLQTTRTLPIVFAFVPDPVGSGFVDSLAKPGGNATGFTQFEYGIAAKWLELLREIMPNVRRVAVIRDPTGAAGVGQFAVIQAASLAQGIEIKPVNVRDPVSVERELAAFASVNHAGMIVTSSTNALVHRDLIVRLANQYKLPTVYAQREFVAAGGLVSYGANLFALLRNAAGYVDRILKGERPADLPVQAPTKFELVVNTKTAVAQGIEFPPTVLARAEDTTQ
jgi:putative tryptophan/tyrosine transport system substrate-binding protein